MDEKMPSKEQIIESNNRLRDKLKNSREENRYGQFKLGNIADAYATSVLRSILIFNAGAISLIPTFLTNFNIENIDHNSLKVGLSLFIISIVSVFIVYLLGYISASAGAHSYIKNAEREHHDICLEHFRDEEQIDEKKYFQELIKQSNTIQKTQKKLETIGTWSEVFAILLFLISLVLFSFGAYISVQALT